MKKKKQVGEYILFVYYRITVLEYTHFKFLKLMG